MDPRDTPISEGMRAALPGEGISELWWPRPASLSAEVTYGRCHCFARPVSHWEPPGTAVERDFMSGVPTAKPALGRADSSAPPAAGSRRRWRGPGQVPAQRAHNRSWPGSRVRHRVVQLDCVCPTHPHPGLFQRAAPSLRQYENIGDFNEDGGAARGGGQGLESVQPLSSASVTHPPSRPAPWDLRPCHQLPSHIGSPFSLSNSN